MWVPSAELEWASAVVVQDNGDFILVQTEDEQVY